MALSFNTLLTEWEKNRALLKRNLQTPSKRNKIKWCDRKYVVLLLHFSSTTSNTRPPARTHTHIVWKWVFRLILLSFDVSYACHTHTHTRAQRVFKCGVDLKWNHWVSGDVSIYLFFLWLLLLFFIHVSNGLFFFIYSHNINMSTT